MNPLLFPPVLIKRALDDLSAIAEATRRIPQLEAHVAGVRTDVDRLRREMLPIQELAKVREGIEPLDEDMRSVRDSVDNLEPLLERMEKRLAALDERLQGIQGDVAPLGDLADKIPGVGD